MNEHKSQDPAIVATYAVALRDNIQRLIDDQDCDIRAILDLIDSQTLCGLITETRDPASRAWCASVVSRLAGAAKYDRASWRRVELGTAINFARQLCERPDLASHEAQNPKPRLTDITDKT